MSHCVSPSSPLSQALPSVHIPPVICLLPPTHFYTAPCFPPLSSFCGCPRAKPLEPPFHRQPSTLQPQPCVLITPISASPALLPKTLSPLAALSKGQAGTITLLVSQMRKLTCTCSRSVSYKWQNQDSNPGSVAPVASRPPSHTVII